MWGYSISRENESNIGKEENETVGKYKPQSKVVPKMRFIYKWHPWNSRDFLRRVAGLALRFPAAQDCVSGR